MFNVAPENRCSGVVIPQTCVESTILSGNPERYGSAVRSYSTSVRGESLEHCVPVPFDPGTEFLLRKVPEPHEKLHQFFRRACPVSFTCML